MEKEIKRPKWYKHGILRLCLEEIPYDDWDIERWVYYVEECGILFVRPSYGLDGNQQVMSTFFRFDETDGYDIQIVDAKDFDKYNLEKK